VEEIFVRFIVAISALALAFVLLIVGLTQKIFFSGNEYVSISQQVSPSQPYLVIDGAVLARDSGTPFITAHGSANPVVAYGATKDVQAWLGNSAYNTLNYDGASNAMSLGTTPSKDPAAKTPAIVNPAGSDMWLGETNTPETSTVQAESNNAYSVIIAADGVQNAPGDITIAWLQPSRVPFANTLMIAGGVIALIGLTFLLWALRHMRRQHGPRRRGRKPPRPPKIKTSVPASLASSSTPKQRGRRALGRENTAAVLGIAGLLTLTLAGCSPYQTGQGGSSASPASESALNKLNPDVSEAQLARIMNRTAATIAKADSSLNTDLAASRLVGPAMQSRAANYDIRRKDGAQAALPAIPSSPLTFQMPQATDSWPRIVMAVVQNPSDTTVPTTGVVLIQNSPRENYHIEYNVTLEPNASVPRVAPASVGSPFVAADSKLLLIAPNNLAAAYGDVLANGANSQYYNLFDYTTDTLVTQIGKEYRDKKLASVADRATIEYSQSTGSGAPLTLATLDSGVISAVSLNESENVKPKAGATVTPEGQVKLLSGLSATAGGYSATYGMQLVFYVPPVGSKDKIRLLGFSQGLIAARGL
jgi:hypothetical protein